MLFLMKLLKIIFSFKGAFFICLNDGKVLSSGDDVEGNTISKFNAPNSLLCLFGSQLAG